MITYDNPLQAGIWLYHPIAQAGKSHYVFYIPAHGEDVHKAVQRLAEQGVYPEATTHDAYAPHDTIAGATKYFPVIVVKFPYECETAIQALLPQQGCTAKQANLFVDKAINSYLPKVAAALTEKNPGLPDISSAEDLKNGSQYGVAESRSV